MFNRMFSAAAAALLAAGAVALSAPAQAGEIEADTVSVRVGDLDLDDGKDAARLERRIKAAAREICGVVGQDLKMKAMIASCQAQVISDANAEVSSR
jgi:UrcA family protein